MSFVEKDTLLVTLPVGIKFINYDVPENRLIKSQLLDSIYKIGLQIDDKKTTVCFISKKNTEYQYYEIEEILEDSEVENIEHLLRLPNIYKFEIYIDKISNKCNKNKYLDTQYCISIYENSEILRRYNIGYIDYNDLSTYTKYWYIDKDYIIHTRIIGGVVEEDEEHENIYIDRLYKYIITDKGHLVPYYNKEQFFNETKTEKGKVKNHTKSGLWIEKKYNYLVFEETYVEANYNKGVPIGKWDFYKLELVYDKEGDINYRESKKTAKLLITEIYNSEGELIEREIYSQQLDILE
ncbi:MAG: hypothetical protein JKY08_03245 [Flavobacteriaceae bacterium]|nr:hypothetical protein [Flavobacteriaceae bacterium]